MNKEIEKTIVKFLTNSATEEDLNKLTNWLKIKDNTWFFDDYIETNYALDMNMNKFDSKGVKKALAKKIKQDKGAFYRHKIYKTFKYAAAAIIVLGLGYFFRNDIFNQSIETEPIIVNNNIEVGSDKATLTLEDGTEIVLEKGQKYTAQNLESNGEEIIYSTINKPKAEIAYNYLTIPRGGHYFVKLSDGSQVWLNSESKLKYPKSFIDGKPREVELVYGEAYFDVSPSTEHQGANFKVYHAAQEIQVLGTEFNIKAYKDESVVYTTLVEGEVKVKTNWQSKVLKPNQQSVLKTSNRSLEVANINVRGEVAWVNGEFILQRKNLKEIMKVLSRWYDMEVTFANKDLEKLRFVGVLGKDQNIVDILNTIKSYGLINDYEINNKNVTLK